MVVIIALKTKFCLHAKLSLFSDNITCYSISNCIREKGEVDTGSITHDQVWLQLK